MFVKRSKLIAAISKLAKHCASQDLKKAEVSEKRLRTGLQIDDLNSS